MNSQSSFKKETVHLTVAQAIVKYLQAQSFMDLARVSAPSVLQARDRRTAGAGRAG